MNLECFLYDNFDSPIQGRMMLSDKLGKPGLNKCHFPFEGNESERGRERERDGGKLCKFMVIEGSLIV